MSQEQRDKIGAANRGRKMTPEHIARTRRRTIPVDEVELRRLADLELSCQDMSAILGVSEETVRRRLRALDIPRLAPKARMDRNYFWRGGYAVDDEGYILVKTPGHPYGTALGYVRQHRLVMEQQLGRYLLPNEVVDHKNRDTSDNDPANLQLFASNADHLRDNMTGSKNLGPDRREARRLEAVRRAHQRVAAILAASGNDAGQ
jgi:predicted DNA-binding protein (UPF0251 family)